MKRIIIAVALVVFLFAVASQAQTPAPKPGPEHKRLHVYNGEWTYEGETKATPLGPADKFTGKVTIRMILNGFFQEARFGEKHPSGLFHSIMITAYDPVNKKYTADSYGSDGSISIGTVAFDGIVWDSSGTLFVGSKQYKMRGKDVLSKDLMSITSALELSPDGSTWTPWVAVNYMRVKASPKKQALSVN